MVRFTNTLDKQSPMPLYHQLKDVIYKEIKNGNWTPDDMIPTELEIMNLFEISRTTVRQALTDLVKEAVLYRKKGVGTIISKPKIVLHYMGNVPSFNSQIQNAGFAPYTKVLELRVIENPSVELFSKLGLPENEKIIRLLRVRYAGNEPIAVVDSYLPYSLCHFILDVNFEKESLYQTLSKKADSKIVHVERVVEAKPANDQDRSLMMIKKGGSVQYFENRAFSQNGTLVEFCVSRYRGDRNQFYVKIDLG